MAIAITRNSQKSRNSFSGEFRVIVSGPIHKNDSSEFFVTHGIMLGSENSEFRVIVFLPYTENR